MKHSHMSEEDFSNRLGGATLFRRKETRRGLYKKREIMVVGELGKKRRSRSGGVAVWNNGGPRKDTLMKEGKSRKKKMISLGLPKVTSVTVWKKHRTESKKTAALQQCKKKKASGTSPSFEKGGGSTKWRKVGDISIAFAQLH